MKISKFSQFITAVENFRTKTGVGELWYRGHASISYRLEPFIHRDRAAADKEQVATTERAIYSEFKRRSPLYDTYVRDEWDTLFLMQHYRAPTRLLDWTSSPLIALFFALMGDDNADDAVVWCLNPAEWNGTVLRDISEPPRILATDESLVRQYHPNSTDKVSRNEPLAIQGIVNNPRINAQKGRFVIFSAEPRALEDFASDYKIKQNGKLLSKIVIESSMKKSLMADLESYGITYSTIFPDLEGLAIEIRRQYGGTLIV